MKMVLRGQYFFVLCLFDDMFGPKWEVYIMLYHDLSEYRIQIG